MGRAAACIALGAIALAGCGGGDSAGQEREAATDVQPAAVQSAMAGQPGETFELSCSYPINGSSDTARTVLERFGKDAKRATLDGAEGTEWPGIVLWGDDPARRMEVYLDEGPGERVSSVVVRVPESRWRFAGVGIGGTAAEVRAANGRPFTFWGFEWDYGGWVTDLGGGKLANLPGACEAQIRLGLSSDKELPEGTVGEVELGSDDPRVLGLAPIVDEMSLSWR